MADTYVCSGAMIRCSMCAFPAQLTVPPLNRVSLTGTPMGNIGDYKPLMNIPSFGPCQSLGFPPTASATAAAYGVLTPMQCMPNIVTPWMPGKQDFLVGNMPALTKQCRCQCAWGGTITFLTDGQMALGMPDMRRTPKKQL